jgi:hypothetical protein
VEHAKVNGVELEYEVAQRPRSRHRSRGRRPRRRRAPATPTSGSSSRPPPATSPATTRRARQRAPLPAVPRPCRGAADADSSYHAAPVAVTFAGVATVLPKLLEAYRTGGGVPYAAYGQHMRRGIAALNRPMFLHELASTWLPAVPDLDRRLRSAPPARVLDVGCGLGASHCDDDLPTSVALLQVPDGLGGLAERVSPVDHWGDLAGLDELLQHHQVLAPFLRDQRA